MQSMVDWCGLLTQMTVEALKVKLSFHVGTNPSSMVLQLLNESGTVVAPFMEDSRKLGVCCLPHLCMRRHRFEAAGQLLCSETPCKIFLQHCQRQGTSDVCVYMHACLLRYLCRRLLLPT